MLCLLNIWKSLKALGRWGPPRIIGDIESRWVVRPEIMGSYRTLALRNRLG